MPSVPFLDLRAQFHSVRPEVLAAVLAVLESQEFSLGIEVETFEREMARFVGCKFAVGCASGADALLLSLMALEIGARDEYIRIAEASLARQSLCNRWAYARRAETQAPAVKAESKRPN